MPVVAVSVSPGRSTPLVVGTAVFTGTAIDRVGSARPPTAIGLPARSVAAAESVGISDPDGAPPPVPLASVTVYGPAPEPVMLENVQPVLVPALDSIAVVSAAIGSENVTEYVAAVRVNAVAVALAIVGAVPSYVIVDAVLTGQAALAGPVAPKESVTALALRDRTIVPSVNGPDPPSVTV